MTVLFHHKRNYTPIITDNMLLKIEVNSKGGETVAIEPIPSWFLEALKANDFFEKKVGKARCSNDDNFNKNIGRDLATSRMKTRVLTVISAHSFGTTTIVILEDSDNNKYTLCSKLGSKIAHFIEYN